MIATSGAAAARNGGVVEDAEPWWPTLRTSMSGTSPRSRSAASIGASASPVSRALKLA
jgi:hypothetical protein